MSYLEFGIVEEYYIKYEKKIVSIPSGILLAYLNQVKVNPSGLLPGYITILLSGPQRDQ